MKVYEILQLKEKIELLENEYDEITGEFIDNSEQIKELIESLQLEKEEKLKAINHIITQKKAIIEINENEIKSIQSFNKQEDKNIIALNDLMGLILGTESVKTNVGSFYFGKESLYIANESKFKQDYPQFIVEKPSIRKEIDKKAVLENIDTLKGVKLRKGVIFRAKSSK